MNYLLLLTLVALHPVVAGASAQGEEVIVRSKSFVYSFDSSSLAAGSWRNLTAKSRLNLGIAEQVELEVGDDPAHPVRVTLRAAGRPTLSSDGAKAALPYRSADDSLDVIVLLRADPNWPILHKSVVVINRAAHPQRLLNVVLGRIPIGSTKTEGGERGFPLYLNGQYFVSVTHPAGFSHVEGKDVVLRQYPGVRLSEGQTYRSMEAIYGVAKRGEARQLFVDYVRSRMCRVLYGQDKPIAILDSFGGQQEGDFRNNFSIGIAESYLQKHLEDMATSRRDNGVNFDYYCMEFWQDRAGDLTTFNRNNFPNGFGQTRDKILDLGMKPALWIDSGGLPDWSIDLNPAAKGCRTHADGTGEFCRASEPIAQMYKDAFLRQMSENKAGLFKFDNLGAGGRPPVCFNQHHDHLPGPLYSTEAIYNSVIDFFTTLRKANPQVFIMLYWGYRSPWWLQWGDTYFECGAPIEGASPAQYPSPYARDAVTQRLDQAQLTIEDTPWLGKDSLGVWLSNWPWNSSIGKGRWQEGTIMDMGRGSLLFQLWTDEHFLSPPERNQVATFIDLMKANPDCFEHSRFILGNPNKAEPYGYSCCNGKRAFLCIDNAALRDNVVNLKLGSSLGLPNGRSWDVYRWYPNPARLVSTGGEPLHDLSLALRPYEVALLEVVPTGEAPSLGRRFREEKLQPSFSESTQTLSCTPRVVVSHSQVPGNWLSIAPISATSLKGATLTLMRDKSILAGGVNPPRDLYTVMARANDKSISGIMVEALADKSLPSNGPGRAVNGNFALTNIRLQIESPDRPEQLQDVKFKSAKADFFQTSYGGWPPEEAIAEHPRTGWSIHPRVGESHVVMFELQNPITLGRGALLKITLDHDKNGHNLGRFRFWVTSDKVAALPSLYEPVSITYSYQIPATKTGGLLFLVGGSQSDTVIGEIEGKPVQIAPVWAEDSNWDCPWTAWRANVGPSTMSRTVEIKLNRSESRSTPALQAHFIPD